jgi:hypothetical protein
VKDKKEQNQDVEKCCAELRSETGPEQTKKLEEQLELRMDLTQ